MPSSYLVNAFVADTGGLDCCSEIRLGLVRHARKKPLIVAFH
jgi:hypothetical protein